MNQEIKENKIVKNNKMGVVIGVVVIVIGIVCGGYISNTPAKRIQSQLELGNKYLDEQKYEEAIIAFAKVIEIDENYIQAYVSSVEAYLQMGNKEETHKFYENALSVVTELDEVFIQDNVDLIKQLYLYALQVYDDNDRKIIILEQGLEITNQNEEVKKLLIEEYLEAIDKNSSDYDKQLSYFDKLLEITDESEIIAELEKCLNKYLEKLLTEGKYDEIHKLAEKYQNKVKNVDFAAIIKEIEEMKKKSAFLQQVYNLMEAEDYKAMTEICESDEMDTFVNSLDEEKFVYISESGGNGIGIYKKDNQIIDIYYGSYNGGIRQGSGTMFRNLGYEQYYRGNEYVVYTIEWTNDMPNGYGELERVGYDGIVLKGNFVNGLAHGTMKEDISNDYDVSISYVADNGVPEDKTEEYLAEYPYFTHGLDNVYVYAYDAIEFGGTHVFRFVANQEKRIGLPGYGNSLY